jgi:hypothetical protein
MDGDTGWHIRTGEWILQHGTVPKTDIFSFTKPHDVWFAWEWGWDVLFALIHRIWGLAGVAFVSACLLCCTSALLFRLIRRSCDHDLLSLIFTILAVCGSALHWLARPHLVSWIFVLIFLHVLLSAERGRVKRLWALPLCALLWTNLHGGFFIGIVIVLISAAGEFFKSIATEQQSWSAAYRKAHPYLLCAIACAAVSFANPYTWHLHQHVFTYLGDSRLLDQISEFQSISFHHAGGIFFECLLLIGGGSVWWCIQHGNFTSALLTILFAHLALLSARNIPLFMLIASPSAGCMFRDFLSRIPRAPFVDKFVKALTEVSNELRPFEREWRLHVVSVFVVVTLAALFAAHRPGFEAQFDPRQFPIEAVPGLATISKSRIFTYDQWGDYLIYRFPGTKVFMDGRSDFYGADFVDTCQQLINAGYSWETDLKRFAINTVIIKPDAALATVLKQSPKWRLLFDNGSVIVFASASSGNAVERLASGRLQVSPVSHNGAKSLAPCGPERGTDSQFINQERRSL